MKTKAYWILPSGEILEPSIYHIGSVIKKPSKFGMSTKELQDIFDKYNEPMSSTAEGKAREHIMSRLLTKGYIRIRENVRGGYSIQLNRLTPKVGDMLWEWANKESQISNDKYADVTIHQLKGNKMTRTSLDQLASGATIKERIGERKTLTPEECNSIRIYKESEMSELPEYFDYAEDLIDENTEQWVIDEILEHNHKTMMKHIRFI